MNYFSVWFAVFAFARYGCAEISLGECSLSCNNENAAPDRFLQPVNAGVPGKRGPKGDIGRTGPPGVEGPKGDNCQCVDVDALGKEVEQIKKRLVRDCGDVTGITSGNVIVNIYPLGVAKEVLCDMDDGGWTLLQRRFDGSLSFNRVWNDYEKGFGSLDGEFWVGLSTMQRMTQQGRYMLKIDLEDHHGNHGIATYDYFRVGPPYNDYKLTVSGYNGDIGDSLAFHNNQKFSAIDRDNDAMSRALTCANESKSGWWFRDCHRGNLNGFYAGSVWQGVHWHSWKHEKLKASTMKIKRIN